MRTITQREFRNNSASVMDAVEGGEVFHITRNGTEVAELRPLTRKRELTSDELVARRPRPGSGSRPWPGGRHGRHGQSSSRVQPLPSSPRR